MDSRVHAEIVAHRALTGPGPLIASSLRDSCTNAACRWSCARVATSGAIAAEARRGRRLISRSGGLLAELLARTTLRGAPDNKADLFSYLFFDASFARPLIELGRADAEQQGDDILDLLS
jgi:hypothetical protein